jgi:hypothetical protein
VDVPLGGDLSDVEELSSDRLCRRPVGGYRSDPIGCRRAILFIPYQGVQLPDAGVLGAFDISFVDPASRTLAVAVSRAVDSRGPFGTVVIVNTNDNVVTKELIPDPPFAGACSFPGRNTVGGPNGVMMPQR